MDWQLEKLNDADLGTLQDALEGMWIKGQTQLPKWVHSCHDAIIAEWDRREVIEQSKSPENNPPPIQIDLDRL